MVNSVWTEIKELPFFDIDRTDAFPFMTPDGKKLFFNSSRPYEGMDSSNAHRHWEIWFVEKSGSIWGKPKKIDFGGKYKGLGTFPSVASNGNIYFNQSFDRAGSDIYYSKYENGIYRKPQRLSDEVNGSANTRNFHPFIAPDESYLLFNSKREGDGSGEQDIYICFRNKDGEWSKAQNIGKTINSPNSELRPFVTIDGKYFFFISDRVNIPPRSEKQMTSSEITELINRPGNGSTDVYWVSAKIIDELKPKEL
jgi:Tol biopolymer transport system component